MSAELIELSKQDAQQAMDAVYGTGYEISDQDVEMMVEFMAIRTKSIKDKRSACMRKASAERGIEW
jgi:hypothetical protein